MVDLPLLRALLTIYQKTRVPSFWEVIDSCFISISKFGSFKNPSAMITSLSELHFRLRRFILLLQTKERVSVSYGSRTSSWKSWKWVRLNWYLRWGIYTSIPIRTHSQNSVTARKAPSLKISCQDIILPRHLSNDQEGHPNLLEISHKLYDEIGHPILSLKKGQLKLRDSNMIKIS